MNEAVNIDYTCLDFHFLQWPSNTFEASKIKIENILN